jgi:hypothetical protein
MALEKKQFDCTVNHATITQILAQLCVTKHHACGPNHDENSFRFKAPNLKP